MTVTAHFILPWREALLCGRRDGARATMVGKRQVAPRLALLIAVTVHLMLPRVWGLLGRPASLVT